MNFKDYTSKEIITLISALIGATGAIFAAIVGISIHNQIVECRLEVNNCINTVNTINTNISSLNSITNTNATYFTEAEKTPTTLFNEAIHAYNAGDYEQVYKIYSEEKICNSPVALTNLGYLYENGYGVQQNFDKATELYDKAIFQAYEPAYDHKIAMYLKYALPSIPDVIYEGYERGSITLETFLECYIVPEPEAALELFCTEYSYEEQMDFLNIHIWKWEDMGYVKSSRPIYSTSIYKYEWVNDLHDIDLQTGHITDISIYHRYKRTVPYIELLNIGFIYEVPSTSM